jgi:hypothetical protein
MLVSLAAFLAAPAVLGWNPFRRLVSSRPFRDPSSSPEGSRPGFRVAPPQGSVSRRV